MKLLFKLQIKTNALRTTLSEYMPTVGMRDLLMLKKPAALISGFSSHTWINDNIYSE